MQSQLYSTFQRPSKLNLLLLVKLCRLWFSKTLKRWRVERETRHTIRIMAELPEEILRDIGWRGAVDHGPYSLDRQFDALPKR